MLVVGAGPSGQQIAAELAGCGRRVHLSVGRHRCLPRRYRGHDTYWWMDRLGMLHRSADSLAAGARRSPNAVLAGGTRDLDVRRLVAEGVVAHGRLLEVDGGTARFADDLGTTLAAAEDNARRFRAAVDAHVAVSGLGLPAEPAPTPAPARWITHAPSELDLGDVAAVVWATGFRRDYRHIDADVFGADGEPTHDRGVTAAAGPVLPGPALAAPAELELHRRGRCRRRVPRRPHRPGSAPGRSARGRGVTTPAGPGIARGHLPEGRWPLGMRDMTSQAAVSDAPAGSASKARTRATSGRIAALSARSRSSMSVRSQS